MSIPSHILDQLNSQADLVAIIGRHTTLKRAGREYKGCCPFHGEKSPSFYVNPQKNIYHCFGCSVGGNAIKFLRDYENLTFLEAVKELSQQTGIEVPQEEKRAVKYQRSSAPAPAPQHGQNRQPSATQQAKPTANHSGSQSNNPANAPSNPPAPNNSVNVSSNHNSSNHSAQPANSPAQNSHNGTINGANNAIGATNTPMTGGYDDYPTDYYIPDDDNPRYDDWEGFGGPSFDGQGFDDQSFAPSGFNGEATASYNQPAAKQEGDLYELLEQIQQYYQRCLSHNNAAKNYFLSRGLTQQTLETFGLGYAPSGWQHLEEQFPRDVAGLKALGLVRRSDSGRDYNLLRDRVIFPIRDNQGRTIGFGGRALDDAVKPKYINSSDSPVFHKQHVLYGYYEARQQRANDWLVVEGYMDVIALYQAGIYGAVATMGTAINEAQISRLLTMNPILTLCFDGDSAGQKAAWRTLELSMTVLSDDKELRFLTLPGGHDPDTYIKANSADAMRQQIKDAMPLSQYVFAYLSERYDLSLAEGKAKLMSQVRALTNQLPKGSSFRSLLNNDIYQKLGGRREQNKAAHDALLNFDSTLTLNFNLYLCLLYQPTILDNRPLQRLWQKSGVAELQIPDKLVDRIEKSGLEVPPLPSWEAIHDEHLATLVATIEKLLPYLPNDTNAASHFILANLPAELQGLLAAQWQQFYRNMVARGVLDLEFLFEELIIQLLYLTLKQQHRQSKNYLIQEILKRRWNTLLEWNKRREAEQAALLNAPIPAAPERPS
ncbi:CHC2 zinc finger domain-containing protein [Psychrobacter arenosus]|uniref:CHC2 zinc finger domain-containing protein n=1 Tax=Psychrobacter arenosus TaxID=256326 RepID=UPI001917F691|nr:CHC2 zinc finger domain-containing protein [Psychrobacter arenosus]